MAGELDIWVLIEWTLITLAAMLILSYIHRLVTRPHGSDAILRARVWRGGADLTYYSASTAEAESLLEKANAHAALGENIEAIELANRAAGDVVTQLLSKVLPEARGLGLVDGARLMALKGFPRGFVASAEVLNDLLLRTILGEPVTSQQARQAVSTARAVVSASREVAISKDERS